MPLAAIVKRAADLMGSAQNLANAIGLNNREALYSWTRIPAERVHAVNRVTGIPLHELRPDLFPEVKDE